MVTMKWITREHVKVDRVACPWLIKKFVDPAAEFYSVPPEEVIPESKKLDATPFGVPGVELGHHGREGSFEAKVLQWEPSRHARSFTANFQVRLALLPLDAA
jgi:hypothetical protein